MAATKVRQRINARLFHAVHRRNLIYNTCWEDPALDRVALNLRPEDRVLVITSAGCNALDYLLGGAGHVDAVDVNPIQNALLELKRSAILHLDHGSFFELFGEGRSPQAREMYRDVLRATLTPIARKYWDRHISFFLGKGWRDSFYYRGTSGLLARLVLLNARVLQRLRRPIEALLEARTLEEQQGIYDSYIRDRLWTRLLRWLLSRSFTMTLAGVPGPQREQLAHGYPGGVPQFVRDRMEELVRDVLFRDNYFWRVYIQGRYTPDCCPEYLKAENFKRLRELVSRLTIHTGTVTEVLRRTPARISRFVLLDHMDWMSHQAPQALVEEWEVILDKAEPGSRAIFRSAGLEVSYLDPLRVRFQGSEHALGSLLRYHPDLATELHSRDRVRTYGSFYIADLPS